MSYPAPMVTISLAEYNELKKQREPSEEVKALETIVKALFYEVSKLPYPVPREIHSALYKQGITLMVDSGGKFSWQILNK